MKTELCGGVCEIAVLGGIVCVTGVPVQGHVHVLKESGANQIDLATATFFCGRAIDANLALHPGLLQPVFDGDGGGNRTRAK